MKIEASSISLAGSHVASTRVETNETLREWIGDRRPDFEAVERAGKASSHVALSPDALLAFFSDLASAAQAAAEQPSSMQPTQQASATGDATDAADNDPKIRLLKLIIEALTGRKIKTISADDLRALRDEVANAAPSQGTSPQQAAAQQSRRAGYGIEYDRHESRTESEQTRFVASGVVHTSDGKSISFQLALSMERSHTEESNVSIRAGDAVRKDPLVINFDGTAAQLQDVRFRFDLNGDGKQEDVPLLAGNRGYLALDLNGNGRIDSGKELFGPASGDGFADLARYDGDHNGWIDENDAVFDKLKVWTPGADGNGALASLRARDVGAIHRGSTQTQFALKGGGNADLGAVRSSGIYLKESGGAGSVQQVDVTV